MKHTVKSFTYLPHSRLSSKRRHWQFATTILAGMVSLLFAPQKALAQDTHGRFSELEIKSDLLGGGPLSKDQATYVSADRLSGDGNNETTLEGNVELRRNGIKLRTDLLRYTPAQDKVVAEGNLQLEQDGLVIEGPRGTLQLSTREIAIEEPAFQIESTGGRGSASKLAFNGIDKLTLENPNYTVCPVDNPRHMEKADWYVQSDSLEIDQTQEVGRARNASVIFKGVPILATPYLSFPTTAKRKSGVLAPSFGSSSRSGTEITLPYYWNIAPNADLTLYPKVVSRRGFNWGAEGRHISENTASSVKVDYLPSDRKTDKDRYAVALDHNYSSNNFSAGVNVNKVSDDEYFVDFSRTQAVASQRVLLREGYASYRENEWDANLRVVRHQTLQLDGDALVEPYDRLPELSLRLFPKAFGPTFLSASTEYAEFASNTRPEAKRSVTRARAELPYLTPSYSINSAVSVQHNTYELDTANDNGNKVLDSTIPTFSLDGTIYFDRKTTLFGKPTVQSLEPRLFYLYTPTVNQDDQPLLDTTLAGEGFSRIFSENRYAGNDRVGDANQVTAGVTSRFTHDKTGAEFFRVDLGQRFYLEAPEVQLAGEPRLDDDSDFFVSAQGSLTKEITINYFGQFDAKNGNTQKGNLNLTYAPRSGHRINAGYRYTRDEIDQLDVSSQWPISHQWSAVGRFNYSVLEKRAIETLMGLEYNGGCWVARFVGQRFAVAPSLSTTSLFFQLELTGLGRIGTNPLELLSRKVSGYTPFSSATSKP